jgi:acyl-CoA reductase-like NAD-dependent aldehyde dehydrogenase
MSTVRRVTAPRVQNFIAGKFTDSSTSKWIALTNPASGETIGKCNRASLVARTLADTDAHTETSTH